MKRRYVRFTRWRRRRFFGVLGESGNVQLAAEAAGVALATVYLAKKREAGFADKWAAAVERASVGLAVKGEGLSAILRQRLRAVPSIGLTVPRTVKDRPGDDPTRSSEQARGGSDGLVIRRGQKGRLRLMAAGSRWWAERHDAVFLAQLRMTGNVAGSARAAGFTPKSAWNRRKRLPSFARAWDAAMADAEMSLEFRLIKEAREGTPAMLPGAAEAQEPKRFDLWLAMWILKRQDQKRAGTLRHGAGRTRVPEIEEVQDSILRKLAAIRARRERLRAAGDG